MTDQDPEEREVITLKIPLDPAHRRLDLALRERGIDVEEVVLEEVTRMVEKQLYDTVQAFKYATEENQ